MEQNQDEIVRVKLPRNQQTLGIVEKRLGCARMTIKCLDNKERICRIPGAKRRSLWVREGNIVLVEPWELQGDQKGDVIYKYSKSQIQWLRRKGYLQSLEERDEF